jgi:hypothetical protein
MRGGPDAQLGVIADRAGSKELVADALPENVPMQNVFERKRISRAR